MEEDGFIPIGKTQTFRGLRQGRLGRYRPVSPKEIESIRSIAARHVDRIVSGHEQTRADLEFVDQEQLDWGSFDQQVSNQHGLAQVTKTLRSKMI